jgi:negative regulator of sigma E activity
MSPATPEDFREQLSAWHDGALGPEAGRFVQRRLDGDAVLRAQLGRWQAIGDALRRQAQTPVTAALPARVAEAIAAQPVPRGALARRWPWLATAAASAFALVLAWPERERAPVAAPTGAPALVAVQAVSPPAASLPAARAPAAMARPVAPLPLRPEARPVPAVPEEPEVPLLARAPQPTAEQLAPLPAVDAPSRPWPRSRPAEQGFTVDYAVPMPADGPSR